MAKFSLPQNFSAHFLLIFLSFTLIRPPFTVFDYLCTMIVAFSGHRSYVENQNSKLEQTIERLYNEGYTIFMSGMADGFDLAAAEAVLQLKRRLPDIKLHCIIPFKGHIYTLSRRAQARYKVVREAADVVIELAERRDERSYFVRNDYLIDKADALLCYYSGKRSGTGYTVKKAIKKCIKIVNLYADGTQILFFG